MALVARFFNWFTGFDLRKVLNAREMLARGVYDSENTIDKTVDILLERMQSNDPLVTLGPGGDYVEHIYPDDL